MPNPNNPLKRHFRQPAIYIKLPSNGKYYPPGALIMPPNNELPVLPMTAIDEITSRTPDALFNGSAVAEIIKSCVPSIRDPWSIPSLDLNSLLVAVRLASYGHNMDINCRCPQCSNNNEFSLDLRTVLDRTGNPDYTKTLRVGELEIAFRPLTYKQLNENNQMQFEDQKLMQVLSNAEIDEAERLRLLGESFRKITRLTVRAISLSIDEIRTNDAIVTDHGDIEEYLHNCEKSDFDRIRDYAIGLRQESDIKPLEVKCSECGTEFKQEFSLDMSNFFETNS